MFQCKDLLHIHRVRNNNLIDYREPNNGESGSSDQNKTLQLESDEEEEPVRAPKIDHKVTDHFHELMKDTSRTVDQIYSKWGDLNAAMKK
ncbi:hypothetical protein R6Q57_017405 [Mikania cordata]